MFSKTSLQQLKDRIDLADLIHGYLPLKRTGTVYKACCPFHEEKSPSFQVQKGAQHYHCFGCGAHGDAFSFVMHQAGLSFVDASRLLADRYQVVLEDNSTNAQEDQEKARSLEIMQLAQAFFVWCFWNHPESRAARHYMHARGLSEDFCRRFALGYSPSLRTELRDYLRSKRVRDEEMEKLGLISASKRDFFSERITFAITNYRSQIIAFSARKYLESTFGGKYINSPETLLFKKSKTLFGLPYVRTRLTKERRAILVEGQLDTLRMIEAGFNFTTAALGTALGAEHVEQLKKLGVESVWLLFDSDAAGREAAAKVGNLLMKEGIDVRVAQLDEKDDPDSVLSRPGGVEVIAQKLESAASFIDFLAHHRSQGKDLRSPAIKTAIIESLKEQITEWQQPLLVYEGLKALARALSVPDELVLGTHKPPQRQTLSRLEGYSRDKPYQANSRFKGRNEDPLALPSASLSSESKASFETSWAQKQASVEGDLLRWLLVMGSSCKGLIEYCRTYIELTDFSLPEYASLWTHLLQFAEKGQPLDFSSAMLELGSELSLVIQELGQQRIDVKKMPIHLQHVVQEIVRRRCLQQSEQLRQEIQSGRLSDDEALAKAQGYATLRKAIPEVPLFSVT